MKTRKSFSSPCKLHPETVCDFVDNYVHKRQNPRQQGLCQGCLQNDQRGNLLDAGTLHLR